MFSFSWTVERIASACAPVAAPLITAQLWGFSHMGVWKKLMQIAQPFRKNLIAILITMSITATLDVCFPLLNRQAIDRFAVNGTLNGLGGFIAVYALCVVCQTTCIFTFINLCGKVEVGLCRLIRQTGFRHLQELPFSFYDKTPVGYLIARMGETLVKIADNCPVNKRIFAVGEQAFLSFDKECAHLL